MQVPQRHRRDDSLELATLDFLGETADLYAQVQEQLREAGADPYPPRQQEGADQSDSVWVSIDAEGRADSVDVSRHWRDRMQPGAFPTALFEAYTDAVRKLVDATAVVALAAEGGPRDDAPGGTTGSRTAPADVPEQPADEREWLVTVRQLLDGIDDQLRRLDRISTEIEVRDRRTATVTSPHGYLTAKTEGQAIIEITGDVHRIRAATDDRLRLEALSLLQAATDSHPSDPTQ